MAHRNYWRLRKLEDGVESLVNWIDTEQTKSPNQKWGIWGAVVGGSSGFVGMSMGIMSGNGGVTTGNPLLYLPFALWLTLAAGMTFWVVRTSKREHGAWAPESRGVMTRLLAARWQGGLRQMLTPDGANLLNSAASTLLQCKATLDNSAWKIAAGSEVWSQMREKAVRSMDSAMVRMLLNITSGSSEEAKKILADMKELNEEVNKAAQRHASVSGVPLGGAEGLRQTLSEMRELATADEEYLQDRLNG